MKRFLSGVLVAAAAVAFTGARAEAQSCTNSGKICGKCNGGAGATVGVLDARRALIASLNPAAPCADDGFGDYDFSGAIGVLDARNILIHSLNPASQPSCNPSQNTVVVRVTTAVASSFGADVTVDLPAGASPDTGAPGAVSTVVDQVGTCGPGAGETQNCKIVAANTSLSQKVRGGSATTQGYQQDNGGVMNLRVDLGTSLPAPDAGGKVILPNLAISASALYGSDGAALGTSTTACKMVVGCPDNTGCGTNF